MALRQMSRKGRPAQAQRRPAMGIRRRAPVLPVAAAPYRAYELRQMSRKGRPAQAQRRPAMGIRRRAPVLPVAAAPYRAYELRQMSRKVGRRKRSAARQWASGAGRLFLPGGGCALPGLRTATNVTER
ncbi:hypothetical protein IUJ34_23780 [Klebsiella pneumoniae subsp. pneumoniae]|uniref:Uncharacterized protein n=1 Tax=Klebsiella pneumoniae subsp. pneumoniae TaxID=72407 RepID=A0A7S9HER7_KLEPN|nr:hypothetical protein IUJ34_23780 [Klebsiella pneumoniae subsp. pneumoniae]